MSDENVKNDDDHGLVTLSQTQLAGGVALLIVALLAPIWMPNDWLQDEMLVMILVATVVLFSMVAVASRNQPIDLQSGPAAPPGTKQLPDHPDVPYYHERLHLKSFLRRSILLTVVISISVVVRERIPGPSLAAILVLVICVYLQIREWWRYQHWTREFNGVTGQGTIFKPGNKLLAILPRTPATINLAEASIGDKSGQNLWEQWFPPFAGSSTLTLDTPSTLDTAFHGMDDFLDQNRARKVVIYCKGASGRRETSMLDVLRRQLDVLLCQVEEQATTNRLLARLVEALTATHTGSLPLPSGSPATSTDDTQPMSIN